MAEVQYVHNMLTGKRVSTRPVAVCEPKSMPASNDANRPKMLRRGKDYGHVEVVVHFVHNLFN